MLKTAARRVWRRSRGEYIPHSYYSETRYFVVQPERYRLPPAPRGYRWILVDDDAYLVRSDNGLVADMVANALASLMR
jgi:Ni/Co efflux regulator RcnB